MITVKEKVIETKSFAALVNTYTTTIPKMENCV